MLGDPRENVDQMDHPKNTKYLQSNSYPITTLIAGSVWITFYDF